MCTLLGTCLFAHINPKLKSEIPTFKKNEKDNYKTRKEKENYFVWRKLNHAVYFFRIKKRNSWHFSHSIFLFLSHFFSMYFKVLFSCIKVIFFFATDVLKWLITLICSHIIWAVFQFMKAMWQCVTVNPNY